MSNYYLKRMLDGDARANPVALDCLQNGSGQPSALSQSLNCSSRDRDLLFELTPSSRCSMRSGGLTKGFGNNHTRARLEAEHLLRSQYDFMILEHLSDPSTPFFLSSLLREPNVELIRKLLHLSHSSNTGLVNHIPARYHPSPPPSPLPPSSASEPSFVAPAGGAALVPYLKYAYLFPKSVLEFLLSENAEDIALYEYAVRLYQHRIQQLISHQGNQSSSSR
jgi:hypothetical protein